MNQMKNDLISIIVPVYNVEKYIKKCLNSLIKQTYKNIEIIIVNDGSSDNSLSICQKFAEEDKRIKIITQENKGLSGARNTGLSLAKGKYISFIDSDDYVSNNYIEKMYLAIKSSNADICCCDFWYVSEDDNKWTFKNKKNKIFTKEEALIDIFTGTQNTEIMVWNKLYKTNLFFDNDIKFDLGKTNEDNFIMYKLYDKASKIVLIKDKLYYYLQRNDSIMGTFNSKRFDILEALDQTKTYFNNQYNQELVCYEFLIRFHLVNQMIKANYIDDKLKELISLLKKNYQLYQSNKYIDVKRKRALKLLNFNYTIYAFALKLNRK